MKKFFYWLPRILGILLIGFLTLFALDVFSGEATIWYQIAGFFIHSIPSIILIVVLVIAWRRPKIGGILFLLASAVLTGLVIYANWGYWQRMIISLLVLIIPFCVIGFLFLIEGKKRKEIQ